MRPRWIPLPLCLLCACAAPVEPDNDTEPDPDPVVVELPVPDEALVCIATASEDVGEACGALGADTLCAGLCLAIHGAGCVAATIAAGEATFVTVGAVAVPAWFVVAAACSLSGGMCVDTCLEIL